MERALDLYFDEIVIGADLNALLYCYIKKIPHVFTRKLSPHKYSFTEDPEKDIERYNHLLFNLSINALSPFGDKVQTIRLEDNNTLKIATKNNFLVNVKFEKLVISDDYKVEGLPELIGKTSYDNCVVDFFGVDERRTLPSPRIEREERIIKTVLFDKRVTRKLRQRSITTISVISDEELKQPEFSETYMRLRMIRLFEPTIRVFHHRKRDVYSLGKSLYDFPGNIRVLTDSIEDIEKIPPEQYEYMSFIERVLWNK
jgi:hypothetical protein